MELKDILKDVVKTTAGLGFEVIKLTTGEDGVTSIEAVNPERTVILKGKAKKPVMELQNSTFGIPSIPMLTGILNLNAYNDEKATLKVVRKDTDNSVQELVFSGSGSTSVYRVMLEKSVPKQPNFKTPDWDVTLSPTKAKVSEFSAHAGVFGAVSGMFKPEVSNTELKLVIGNQNSSNHSSSMCFADTISGTELKGGFSYPIDRTLKALGLTSNNDTALRFSSKGVMQLEVDTGGLELTMIFPGHSS